METPIRRSQAESGEQTPLETRRLQWGETTVAATPGPQDSEVLWRDLPCAAQRLWQGWQQPKPRGTGDDSATRSQEKRLDELWRSAANKGSRLSEITPNPGSAEVPVPDVLQLLNALEAMREAVITYAHGVNEISLGQMQFLLHSLLRRQAGPKWVELVELSHRNPMVRWAEMTKRACGKLNVQSREDWETILTAFSRTGGSRVLTLGEFAFRFRIMTQASAFAAWQHDGAFLYEKLLRGAQTPGLVYWAQARARQDKVRLRQEEARVRGDLVAGNMEASSVASYTTLAQGFMGSASAKRTR